MKFQTAEISNAGGRKSNQDDAGFVILETQNAACWVLADGLGGHMGGETASKTAINAILEAFRRKPECSSEAINNYLEIAQKEILRLQNQNPRLSRMRTTVVIMVTDFESVLWGHIGDSRLYRLVDGKIDFQTKDHSVPQTLVASGDIKPDQIRSHEDRNRLLRTMGQPESFRPHIHENKSPLYHNDVFLLCSDGFWEFVNEAEMEIDYSKAADPGQWLEKMEGRILERARGEFDNYTAIAIFTDAPVRQRPRQRILPEPVYPQTAVTPPADKIQTTVKEDKTPSNRLSYLILSTVLVVSILIMVYLLFQPGSTGTRTPDTSPGPAHSKRIYRPQINEYYKFLGTALEEIENNEEIHIGQGSWMLDFKYLEKTPVLIGKGKHKTYVLIMLKYDDWANRLPSTLSGQDTIYSMVKNFARLFREGVKVITESSDNIIKILRFSGKISIIIVNDKMEIVKIYPPRIKPKEKQKLESGLELIKWIRKNVMNKYFRERGKR